MLIYGKHGASHLRPVRPAHARAPRYQMDTVWPQSWKFWGFILSLGFLLSLCDTLWRMAANSTLILLGNMLKFLASQIEFPAIFSKIFCSNSGEDMGSWVALLIAQICWAFWEIRAPFSSPGPGYFAPSAPPPPPSRRLWSHLMPSFDATWYLQMNH